MGPGADVPASAVLVSNCRPDDGSALGELSSLPRFCAVAVLSVANQCSMFPVIPVLSALGGSADVLDCVVVRGAGLFCVGQVKRTPGRLGSMLHTRHVLMSVAEKTGRSALTIDS